MNATQIRREKVTKVYAALITLMLVASTTGLIIYQDSVANLEQSMDDEKLKSESLFSEKLNLEKAIAVLQKQMIELKGQNSEIAAKWKNAMASISDKDRTISNMNHENRQARNVLSEVKGLREMKSAMEQDVERLLSELGSARTENERLNGQVASLRASNDELSQSLASLNQVAVNNSLVEATKGKHDRLTVKASKTRKLKVGFDLPEDMIGNLYFKMLAPDGTQVSSDKSIISYYETPIMGDMVASLYKGESTTIGKKHIEMIYQPEEKLKCGIYTIDVYSGGNYLGTTRVRLN